ncbi:aquaporin [Hymenobacter sp. YC55]|uniref:aquaporin n=1 Tax=Hymenobacter sp. YC55 TaxID=3034019 RepID=UPI0023FA099C|nr:aquaporin [Hymenobacter sp. YC55]MDF7815401.1 aquaporin [Hymenobacter sp. YC55]
MSTASNIALSSQTWFAVLPELVGTFFLTIAALTVASPLTAYAVSLTLLVFVYAVGGLSGAHLNPAVTVGLVASRRFPLVEGLLYVAAQVGGALLARLAATAGLVGPPTGDYHAGSTGAEFLGFGLLMLTVAAATEKKVTKAGSGLAVGGALLAGLLVSKGILNPAVAIAMGVASSPALWATLLSGVAFGGLYSLFERAKPPEVEA